MPIKEAVNIYDYEFKNRSNLFNHGVRLRRGNSHGFFCRNGLDVPAYKPSHRGRGNNRGA